MSALTLEQCQYVLIEQTFSIGTSFDVDTSIIKIQSHEFT
jgi:hypothetical protein